MTPVLPCTRCPSQLARPLLVVSRSSQHRDRLMGASTYLAAVNVAVCDVEGDISRALEIDALAQGLAHGGTGPVLSQDLDDGLNLLGFQLESHVSLCRAEIHPYFDRDLCRGRREGREYQRGVTAEFWGRPTLKPGVEAQTLSPAMLMIAPLSMWPVATRLIAGSAAEEAMGLGRAASRRGEGVRGRSHTSCQHMLGAHVLATRSPMTKVGVVPRGDCGVVRTLPGHDGRLFGEGCSAGRGRLKIRREAS